MIRVGLAASWLIASVSSQYLSAPSWVDLFRARGAPLPAPLTDCQVCFFEDPDFGGNCFCVGPRVLDLGNVLIISSPSTVGSIKFYTSAPACNLVANIRVLDPPYDRHIDVVFEDVADTKYDDVVQELYVEDAGRACFLAAKDINHYGVCYNSSVAQVEAAYRDALYEALLFKTREHNFYVTVYEEPNFQGLSKRLSTSTEDLSVWTSDDVATMKSLQMRIRSIAFTETYPPLR